MALTEVQKLLPKISPPIDRILAEQLLQEFVSIQKRYILRDWEPAELDGGQFAEILGRILYQLDSGNLNRSKAFDECLSYIEDENGKNKHEIIPRKNALHIGRVLRTLYKFRSDRGAVHISPNYVANQMDSRLMVECVRWGFSEVLRLFWNGDRGIVEKAIRELVEFNIPCIGKFDDSVLVQRTDLNAEQELLVLLHYAGTDGFSRKDIGNFMQFSAASVTGAIQKLCSPQFRQVIQLSSGRYRLTDLGAKRVMEELGEKLLLE